MSRITDIERGARIARDAALTALQPSPLFPIRAEILDLWWSILDAAGAMLAECRWSREVLA